MVHLYHPNVFILIAMMLIVQLTTSRLEMLPMEIEERCHAEESVQFVLNFAKKTGDIRSLSKTDMAGE